MKTLIFGSTAIKHWFPEFRDPKDLDIISQEPVMTQGIQHYWFPTCQYFLDNNKDSTYLDPEFLYHCKAATLGWNVHWDKTVNDVLFFQQHGFKLNTDLYKLLVKDFTQIHGKKWASLKGKDSTSFFEDSVARKYNHDSIHEAVAYYNEPIYKSVLKGPESVLCDKDKFEKLLFEDKIKMVKEEVFVTALERFLIPNDFKYSANLAYWRSLKKLTTTMSSGWFKMFIIANFIDLYKNSDDYVQKFNNNQEKLKLC